MNMNINLFRLCDHCKFMYLTSQWQVPLWHSPCPEQLSAQVPFHAIIPNLTSNDNGFCVVIFIIVSILPTDTSSSALWYKKKILLWVLFIQNAKIHLECDLQTETKNKDKKWTKEKETDYTEVHLGKALQLTMNTFKYSFLRYATLNDQIGKSSQTTLWVYLRISQWHGKNVKILGSTVRELLNNHDYFTRFNNLVILFNMGNWFNAININVSSRSSVN
jgi:hypothetical protein